MFEARQITYDEVGDKEAQLFNDSFSGIQAHYGNITVEQYREKFVASKDTGLTGLFHETHGLVAILKYGKALIEKIAYTTDIMKINFSDDTGWLIKADAQEALLSHSRDQGYKVVVVCGMHSSQEDILSDNVSTLDIVQSVTKQSRGAFTDILIHLN